MSKLGLPVNHSGQNVIQPTKQCGKFVKSNLCTLQWVNSFLFQKINNWWSTSEMFTVIFILNFFHSQITFFKCSAKCVQHFNTTYWNLCCAQHIALVWPPFCNILQDVGWWNRAEKCVLHVMHNNVAICCLNWKAACVWLGL